MSIERFTGVLKFFHVKKGYGVITPDGGGEGVIVHWRQLENIKLPDPPDGIRVKYSLGQSDRPGKLAAVRIVVDRLPFVLDEIKSGTVKFYSEKGYGFIRPDGGGQDVFVQADSLALSGLKGLTKGERVTYVTGIRPKGPYAHYVSFVSEKVV